TQREDSLANSQAAVDLAYTLNGVEAHWENDKGQETWNGWLPHLNLEVSQALTKGSTEHEKFFNLLEQPGKLSLTTRIVLPSPPRRQGHLQGPESIVLNVQPGDGWEGFVIRDQEDTQWLASGNSETGLLLIRSRAKPLITFEFGTGKGRRRHHASYQLEKSQQPKPLPLAWQMLP